MSEDGASLLSAEQANEDVLEALLAAGFGRPNGRPVGVLSWPWQRASCPWQEYMRSEVTVAARHADEALRAMLTVPGGVMLDAKGGTLTLFRDRRCTPACPPAGCGGHAVTVPA